MVISVRSQLLTGAAAVAVAGAVAVTPLPASAVSAASTAPAMADVSLAALATPLQELLGTLNVAQTYLLGSFYNGSEAPVPGAGSANWFDAGFDQTGGDFLNFQLTQLPQLGNYLAVGILPQLVNQAQPILRQIESNLLDYLNVGISGLIDAGIALNAGVWGFPPALIDAAQLALAGQFGPAFEVITKAIITPTTTAGSALLDAGGYILNNVVARLSAVISAIPQIVTTYVGWSVGGAALLAEKTAGIASQWIDDLTKGDFGAAWNTAVQGLLGPSGLPGLSLNLAIGAGVQTGPITQESDIAENFVPSARTAVQATAWTLREALGTNAATSVAATRAPAAAEAAPALRAAAVAETAPAVDTTESAASVVETPPTSGAGASEDQPAKATRAHRASRAAR